MLGCTENIALLSLETMKLTVWPASSAGPAEMAVTKPVTVWAPESSSVIWSAPTVKLGTSLTAGTLIVKVCTAEVSTPPLAVPPSSCSATETVALPLALAAGV